MGRQARSGRKRQYMHFGLEERNNLERRSREVDTTGIQYIEECRMKQVNSEPGEPDCDPCLTDHVICYQASVEWGCFKGFIRTIQFNVLMPGVLPEYKYHIDKKCLYLFEQFVNSDNHCGSYCCDKQ